MWTSNFVNHKVGSNWEPCKGFCILKNLYMQNSYACRAKITTLVQFIQMDLIVQHALANPCGDVVKSIREWQYSDSMQMQGAEYAIYSPTEPLCHEIFFYDSSFYEVMLRQQWEVLTRHCIKTFRVFGQKKVTNILEEKLCWSILQVLWPAVYTYQASKIQLKLKQGSVATVTTNLPL